MNECTTILHSQHTTFNFYKLDDLNNAPDDVRILCAHYEHICTNSHL